MKITKTILFKHAILSFFFLYLFLVFNTYFHGTDEPIYFNYTASVVEDGDLNVINQYYSKGDEFNVTNTYNFPDCHNYGGILLWIPFYSYAKLTHFIATKLNLISLTGEGLYRITRCAMSFSTILFGFLIALLTYKFCRIFFSAKIVLWSILIISLGTPLIYFSVYEVGQVNIIACLFATLSLLFCGCVINTAKRSHWFLYGLFFSICTIIKLDLWFQLIFIFLFFTINLLLKQTALKNGAYFFLGFIPMHILKIINDSIQYGALHIREFGQLYPITYYFPGVIIPPYRSFIYTSPVFYICLLGAIFIIIDILKNIKTKSERKKTDIFFLILVSYLFIKIFIIGMAISIVKVFFGIHRNLPIETRLLLTEFTIFVLLYAKFMQEQKKLVRFIVGIVSIFFVVWHLLVLSEHITNLGPIYITYGVPNISLRIATLKYTLDQMFFIKNIGLKLKLCLPLAFITLGVVHLIGSKFRVLSSSFWHNNKNNYKLFRFFTLFTTYLCSAYIVITLFNVYNNKKNVEKLKAGGFFKNAVIIKREFDEGNPGKNISSNIVRKIKNIIELGRKEAPGKLIFSYDIISAEPYYKLGIIYKESMNIKRAIECFQKAIQLNPEFVRAYRSLGHVYDDFLGEYGKAIEYFQKAIQFKPDDIEAYRSLGDIYLKTGDYPKSIEYSGKVISLDSKDAEAYRNLGSAYYKLGQHDQTGKYYKKSAELNLNDMNIYFFLADFYNAIGEYYKVIEYLEMAERFNPIDPDLLYRLGATYKKWGDCEIPVEYFQKIIQFNPDNSRIFYDLGMIYESKGGLEKAIEHYQKALQLDGNYAQAYHSLGDIYGIKGDYDREMDCLKRAIQLNPRDKDAYRIPTMPYGRKIYYDKAIKCLKEAIHFNSRYSRAESYYLLGIIYKEKRNPACIDYLQKAIKLNPGNADFYHTLGMIFYQMEDIRCIDYLQKSVEHNSNNPETYYYLGLAYRQTGNPDKATACFHQAIKLNPYWVEAYYELGNIYYRKGDREALLAQIVKLRELNREDLAKKLEQCIAN